MGWLQEHLETFVKPVLGSIPTVKKTDQRFFTPAEFTLLKNIWRSVKCEARRLNLPVLLTGRDVYVFYVLAMRERGTSKVPIIYRSDISRQTKTHIKEDYTKCVCLDTGYSGTIASALQCQVSLLLSSSLAGQSYHYYGIADVDRKRRPHVLLQTQLKQVFPRNKGIRLLATKLERTPKYWETGEWVDPHTVATMDPSTLTKLQRNGWNQTTGIVQYIIRNKKEFETAAHLTIQVYTDSSSHFAPTLDLVKCQWPSGVQASGS